MMKRDLRFVLFAVVMVTLMVTLAFLPASAQLSQWRSLNPTRDGRLGLPAPYLNGVQMLATNYGWAVGGACDMFDVSASGCNSTSTNRGFVLFWDGSKWRESLIPGNAGALFSVFIVSANDVWAVGTNSTIIHWDGISWVTAPVPAGIDKVYSIFMLPGGMDGWAVGYDFSGVTNILRWSGSWPTGAWSVFPTPAGAADLRGVALSSPTEGWAVGRHGTIFRWDGAGWLAAASPTTVDLFSVSIVSSANAWAVGHDDTIIWWNGASWTGPMTAPTTSVEYRSIHMVSAGDGWIAGTTMTTTKEGLLLRWDGTAWSLDPGWRSWVTENLNDVYLMPGGAVGAAVGDAETIIHWNGSEWLARTSPTSFDLNSLYLISASDGWAVGDTGTICRWNGQSWHHYETLPSGVNLFGLFMKTGTDAWAVGAPNGLTSPTILRWNSLAWAVVSPPGVALGETLYDVYMLNSTWGWAVGTGSGGNLATALKWDGVNWGSFPSGTAAGADLYSVHMLSSTDGWAVGATSTGKGPVIVHWNGLAWSLVTAPLDIGGLNSVHFLSATNGWAVGNNGTDTHATIIHWNGAQWTRVPAPEGNLTSVYMTSASDGWAVGQNSTTNSLSLIVHWDGLTWNVVSTPPVPPTMQVALRSVFMVTELDGWIVSNQGLILKYGPEMVPGTTTSYTTVISTTTSTTTSSSATSSTTSSSTTSNSTTSTSTYVPPAPVPGFPIESILAGLLGGLIALTMIRRRRRL